MKKSYVMVLKNSFFRTSALFLALASLGIAEKGYAQEASNRVAQPEKWSKGGLYDGFNPSQELLDKRSRTTKHFKNSNGSITAQIGEAVHYQDNSGKWQDIDYSIVSENANALKKGYKFSNETNEIKSYFPENSGSKSVMMNVGNNATLSWWNNPHMSLTDNGQVIKNRAVSQKAGKVKNNKIVYENVYSGMSEEFEVISGGLENNIIINSLSNEIKSLSSTAKIEFSQTIELDNAWTVYANGNKTNKDFNAKKIFIAIPGSEGVTFNSIFIFDNNVTKEEAIYITSIPMAKLTLEQKRKLENNIFQCDYKAEFTLNGLKITTVVPVSWLKNSNRQFPVTVDPVVTIGNGATGEENPYGPIVHLWGFERYANLYLQSEIGGYGAISSIEYYKRGTQAARTKPTKVYMRTTAATELVAGAAWNSTTYTGGLTPLLDGTTTQDATAGWKMITLPAGFGYNSDNLLIMVKSDYGGSGSSQYMSRASITGRQAYLRADTTDPLDSATAGVEGYRPDIRITYMSDPPAITSFTPATGCSSTSTVVITGSGFSGVTSLTIGGTPVTSFVTNSSTQITAVVGNGTSGPIAVTTGSGSATSITDFTVNISPSVNPIVGASSGCVNSSTAAFTNATTGGTWGVINGSGSATIDASGVLTGTTVGTVTVTYSISNATCTTVVNKVFTVNNLPGTITIDPVTTTFCPGSIKTLTVNGATASGNAVLGTGTTAPGATAHPNPFNAWFGGSKVQILYLKSELEAQGISAGYNINSIVFDFFASVDKTCNDLKIRIGATTDVATTATAFVSLISPLTTVYSGNYTPVNGATGPVTFAFSTSYVWDGVSNIIIEVVHNQGNGGNGSGTRTKTTTTAFNSVWYGTKDNVTPAGAASIDALTVTDFTTGTSNRGTSTLRPNVIFGYSLQRDITWSPITDLYSDTAATVPYVSGASARTVYAKPTASIAYTASVTNANGCSTSATSSLTANAISALPSAVSPQTFTAGQTLADLVVTGNGLIWYSDATGATVIPNTTLLVSGTTYYVSQTVVGSCESIRLPIQADLALGTPLYELSNLRYYPNPVKDVLNLSYIKNISDVSVFNILGQKVISKLLNSSEYQLDMSNLSAGTYLVKIRVDNMIKTVKVTKKQ